MDTATIAGGVTRRRFVAASTVVVGGSMVGLKMWPKHDPADLPGLHSSITRGSARPEVGYLDGSDLFADLLSVPFGTGRVTPARLLSSGDPAFIGRLVKVSILGLTPGFVAGAHPTVRNALLDVLMPHPDRKVTEPVPQFAWTLRTAPYQASNRTSTVVAIGHKPRLGFTLDVGQHDGESFRATSIFTTGRDQGAPRLRRGIDLLGLRPGSWSAPRALAAADAPDWTEQISLAVALDHG
jgi:hypothetical protein